MSWCETSHIQQSLYLSIKCHQSCQVPPNRESDCLTYGSAELTPTALGAPRDQIICRPFLATDGSVHARELSWRLNSMSRTSLRVHTITTTAVPGTNLVPFTAVRVYSSIPGTVYSIAPAHSFTREGAELYPKKRKCSCVEPSVCCPPIYVVLPDRCFLSSRRRQWACVQQSAEGKVRGPRRLTHQPYE